jgi:kynurenine formamidase
LRLLPFAGIITDGVAKQAMSIIDLSHFISPRMPVYPGTEPPVFETGCSIDEDGFLEKKITFYSHTGTHMDAPAHLIDGAKTLEQLPIEHFYGKAILLNRKYSRPQTIDVADLEAHRQKLKQVDFLLIHTGWSRYWGTERYFSGYPVLSAQAANWLDELNLKGIGLDAVSADQVDSQNFPIHKSLLRNDTIIIENLVNLEKLPGDPFMFACFPLKLENADGSPVRAVAFI